MPAYCVKSIKGPFVNINLNLKTAKMHISESQTKIFRYVTRNIYATYAPTTHMHYIYWIIDMNMGPQQKY